MANADELPFSLAGMRVLITGADGGMGVATSKLCARLGADLILVDRQKPTGLAEALPLASSQTVSAVSCDLSDRAQVDAMAKATGPVDGIVDLAAVCPYNDWHEADWNDTLLEVMAINVGGPINLLRAYFPAMVENRFGRVVLTGSLAGRTGGLRAAPHYSASKGSVHTLVRWFAQRGSSHNVLVNGISPGTTDTPMMRGQGYDPSAFPLGRFATPEEMAGPIAFLLSPAASFVAGVILDVNGGIHYS
ncbi:SDR family NAD(P)-dependent oxidoreductase [Rhodoligotrophos defluvii]|uniref:SDR family NAD(P)-dependent oxidoreductase n=1 Tax=Rhodoligotrophos defluvii TaxID=2561934 RepID=UPI001484D576|nr:SDR family oxidoreductase [Rhodoligotrophos defluvii]